MTALRAPPYFIYHDHRKRGRQMWNGGPDDPDDGGGAPYAPPLQPPDAGGGARHSQNPFAFAESRVRTAVSVASFAQLPPRLASAHTPICDSRKAPQTGDAVFTKRTNHNRFTQE